MYLAVLIILSPSAGTVAFADTAAADVSTISVESADDVPIHQDEVTQEFELSVEFTDDSSDAIIINGIPAAVSVENIDVRSGNTNNVTVTDTSTSGPSFELQSQVDGTTTTTVYVSLEYDTSALGTNAITTGNGVSFDFVGGSATGTATFDIVAGNDAQLNSGSTYWRGQKFAVYIEGGSSITVGGVTIADDDELQIREYNTSGDNHRIGSLIEEFRLENGYAEINTYELYGDYVITPASDSTVALEITNGRITAGYQEDTLAGRTVRWDVTTQDLMTDFDGRFVNNKETDSTTVFEIKTTRASSDIEVSADGLTQEELLSVFSAPAFNAQPLPEYDEDSDDTIVLKNVGDLTEETDFEGIKEGKYDFYFDVADTATWSLGIIEVIESDVQAGYRDEVITETAGDIVEVSVRLEGSESVYMQIGGQEAGFTDVLYLEDDDTDDDVTFSINTRALGTGAGVGDVYHTEGDLVESEVHDGISSANAAGYFEEDTDGSSQGFEWFLYEQGLIDSVSGTPTNQLRRPLQPTTYELMLAENGHFTVTGEGESEADVVLNSGLLELTPPSIDSITTYTAPEGNADVNDEVAELLEAATPRREIAMDDRLVVHVEATGLYGALAYENGFDALTDGTSLAEFNRILTGATHGHDWRGEGINFHLEVAETSGNQEPTSLDLTNDDTGEGFVAYDEPSGQFFIVIDTGADDDVFTQSLADGSEFEALLKYETDAEERYAFDTRITGDVGSPYEGDAGGNITDTPDAAYPYFQPDSTQEARVRMTIVERDVIFDTGDDDVLEVPLSGVADISGRTNIAPGTEAQVRVSSIDASPPFRSTTGITIARDGTFSAEFDFSEQSAGGLAGTTFYIDGRSVGQIDTKLVSEDSTDTPQSVTLDLDPERSTQNTETLTPETDTLVPSTDTPVSRTDTPASTSGFGVIVALTALAAAALLVIQRKR
ncbi:BGTF surface domain-containing protein [Halobellus inordinatus]|uniref:BGTF surface domain-containing protein n=1 Tax=Halobellus inordinatus TaxID=1126236 RepID=UPI0021152E8B|nr:BGTF surface domain-containing protein [Halobellus ramosii]